MVRIRHRLAAAGSAHNAEDLASPRGHRERDDRSRHGGESRLPDHARVSANCCFALPHRYIPIDAKNTAQQPVEHDHQEDRLNHRGGGTFATRHFPSPATLAAGDDADHQRYNGALMMPTSKWVTETPSWRHEDGQPHAAVEPGHPDRTMRAAIEPIKLRIGSAQTSATIRSVRSLDRVQPHGRERVDLSRSSSQM